MNLIKKSVLSVVGVVGGAFVAMKLLPTLILGFFPWLLGLSSAVILGLVSTVFGVVLLPLLPFILVIAVLYGAFRWITREQ